MTRARQDLLVKNMIYTLKNDKIEIVIFRASRFFFKIKHRKKIYVPSLGAARIFMEIKTSNRIINLVIDKVLLNNSLNK